MNRWELALKLDSHRNEAQGSARELTRRLLAGADLRVGTAFYHDEHIDSASGDHQLVEETADFPQTVVLDGSWSAGIMTLRQPVSLKKGFGACNSLSLFLYNQNGQQALARLAMEDAQACALDSSEAAPEKMCVQSINDPTSMAPSQSFVYQFEYYDFFVNDCYSEIYANDALGQCTFGGMEALTEAYRGARRIKIGIGGLLSALYGQGSNNQDEVFIQCGCSYYYTEERLMIANSNPLVCLPTCVPLIYTAGELHYCWLVVQSDGRVFVRLYDPFTCRWQTRDERLAVRWFAQD